MKMIIDHMASCLGGMKAGMKAQLHWYISQREQEDLFTLPRYRQRSKCVKISVTSKILVLMVDHKNKYLTYKFSWQKKDTGTENQKANGKLKATEAT